MVDHQAAILHDVDACAGETLGRRGVSNAELEPDRARAGGEDVLDVRVDVVWPAKHVDQIDLARDVDETAVDGPPEDLRHVRVIDGHRNHVDAGVHEILRDVERRLKRLGLGLDAEHGDTPRLPCDARDPLLVFDQMGREVASRLHAETCRASPGLDKPVPEDHSCPPMADDLLSALRERLDEDIDGIARTEDGLEAIVDARYGEVVLEVEHDVEAQSLRLMVCVPPPAGAGADFLIWALSTNTQYWDVKIGLDEAGHLVIHADLDAEGEPIADLAGLIVDRTETILELLDADLVEWLLEHGLGTPAQRERWISRKPTVDEEP